MRMTVGPLPSTVYWRRRAIVLGAVLALVVLVAWGCAAAGSSSATSGGRAGGAATGHPAGSTTSSPTASAPALLPGSPSTTAPATGTPAAPANTTPAPGCTDAELTVVPAAVGKVQSGSYPRLSVTIGSTAAHDCSRDIGADQQELRLMQGNARIWSSDDCDPTHGSYLTTFHPGTHVTYTLVWAGKTSTPGCKAPRTVVPPGSYQLVGRVGTKVSTPVPITIT
jgi:hypothetical protein